MEVDVLAAPLIIIACFMLLILFWYTVSRKPKGPPFCLRRVNADKEWETVCTFRDQSPSFASHYRRCYAQARRTAILAAPGYIRSAY